MNLKSYKNFRFVSLSQVYLGVETNFLCFCNASYNIYYVRGVLRDMILPAIQSGFYTLFLSLDYNE